MAKLKLTDVFLRKVNSENESRVEYSDELVSGLRVRVYKTGKKMFVYTYRVTGKQRQKNIGEYPAVSLSQARKEVQEMKVQIRNGTDPQVVANDKYQETQGNMTVENTLMLFLEKRITGRVKSAYSYKLSYERLHRDLKSMNIEDIKPFHIRDHLIDIGKKYGLNAGNKSYVCLRSAFTWLFETDVISQNTMLSVKKPFPEAEIKRDVLLSDENLKSVFTASDEIPWPYGQFIKVLLLTGQRRGEVATMRWEHLNIKQALWTIPAENTKNGKAHQVPLSDLVIETLMSLPSDKGFLFSTTFGEKSIGSFSKLHKRIKTLSNTDGWTFHDLRRTLATRLSQQGTPDVIISSVLNHSVEKLQGVTSIYNRNVFMEERREALQKYADWVRSL